jgi:hypothetical protein
MPGEITLEYLLALALWPAAFAMLLARAWGGRQPVVGLALAYWINLAMIHLLGGAIQLLPWHHSPERANTLLGFPLTGLAMAGLLVGQFLCRPGLFLPREMARAQSGLPLTFVRPTFLCAMAGLFTYFGLGAVLGKVPSLTAILSNGLNLTVAGFCLLWWTYYRNDQRNKAWIIVGCTALIPAMTVLLRGFLGFGVCAVLSIACFIAAYYTPRKTVLIAAVVVAFLALSLWAVYSAARTQIRSAVWGGRGMDERLETTSSSLEKNMSLFDFGSSQHLASIESRLNQNYLLGASRRMLEAGEVPFAEGETMVDALVALVPRAIWPEKPQFAGSGMLVTRFTGIRFVTTTSVGIGQVMELYVNFGAAGVFLGYVLISIILSLADYHAGRCLLQGKMEAFLVIFVAGQTLLMTGGAIAEIPPAAVGGALLAFVFSRICFSARVRQLLTLPENEPARS